MQAPYVSGRYELYISYGKYRVYRDGKADITLITISPVSNRLTLQFKNQNSQALRELAHYGVKVKQNALNWVLFNDRDTISKVVAFLLVRNTFSDQDKISLHNFAANSK